VYDITDVPAVMPLTSPVDEIVATGGLLLDHVPPEVASLNRVVEPTQTLNAPEIGAGLGLTAMT
jgi:hypothetical protein